MFSNAAVNIPTVASVYPNAPTIAPTQPALPLSQYAGRYSHPGYGTMELRVKEDKDGPHLCTTIERIFSRELVLRHVNSEYWFGTSRFKPYYMSKGHRARSCIGVDSKVEAFEIALEPEMPDTLFRYERCT
jgi:hypothetical protein